LERTFSAMPVVQAFTREAEMDRSFAERNRAVLQSTLAATTLQMRFKILMGLATAVGTAGLLWFGARHALAGQLTVGSLLVFLSYLGSLYAPIQALLETPSTLQTVSGSARRVVEILEMEPEVRDSPTAKPLPPVRGRVRFEGVTFGYEP